jgi:p-cumate 2,3-dioxygenase alpha subunit
MALNIGSTTAGTLNAVGGCDTDGLVIDDRESGIFRIHRSAFTDPKILELEKARIFDRSWLFAGHISELPEPGDFVTRNVGGRPVILMHGEDGQVRVLMNTCRHRGNLVCRDGSGKGAEVLRCFYHGWVYSTRGELIGVPGEDAYSDAFDRDALGLEPAPRMENYRGMLFVSFDPEIESLEEYLGDAKSVLDTTLDLGDMEVVGGVQYYSMRANWKLLVENSMDGYHFAFTHERYSDFLKHMAVTATRDEGNANGDPPRPAVGLRTGPGRITPFGKGHVTTAMPNARSGPRPATYMARTVSAGLDEHLQRLEARFGTKRALEVEGGSGNYLIFPTFIVIDLWRTLRTFYPISPDYMEITAWALMPKEDSAGLRAARLDNFLSFLGPGGFGTPDDVEALEGCQMGFAAHREVEWSDISRGMKQPTASGGELQMRTFWREWASRLATGQHTTNPGDEE